MVLNEGVGGRLLAVASALNRDHKGLYAAAV
jgi:hypothetical protein